VTGIFGILRNLPVTVRVPLFVAGLMLVVAVIASQQVLQRLSKTQTEQLSGLASAYLDGLSAAISPYVLRKDVWEVFDALDRSRNKYKALHPVETIVADEKGIIIASSEPRKLSSQKPVPDNYKQRFSDNKSLLLEPDNQRAYVRRVLHYQGKTIGTIYATLDIHHLMAERRTVFFELVLTNLGLAMILAAMVSFSVRRMLRPVKILSDHLEQGASGKVETIPFDLLPKKHSEFTRLFRNYNALAKAVHDRSELAERLALEERLASLGRLASGMAHEINNPLGGLFNAVDTLKRHGDTASIRKSSLNLLERGLSGIRDVVSAALATYRPEQDKRNLNTKDIDDLALLLQPELRRRKLSLDWNNLIENEVPVEASPVRQAALNLLLNAAAASPGGSAISLQVEVRDDTLKIAVGDSGSGLPAPAEKLLTGSVEGAVPVVEGSGIGLWMVQRLIREIGATIEIDRSRLGGALIICIIELNRTTGALDHAA